MEQGQALVPAERPQRDPTRDALKRAARRLFAERGVDGASVREIVTAAGQKNAGALHYYFGGKDDLVRELILDGARMIDDARQAMLDAMEAAGPVTVRDAVRALVEPSFELNGDSGEHETYLQFIQVLQTTRREFFLETLGGRWAQGYQRCLDHMRRHLGHLSETEANQRLLLMGLALGALAAAREAALYQSGRAHPFWGQQAAVEAIIDAVQAIVEMG